MADLPRRAMPVGRLSLRHALIGGATATLLWEITRHVLAWYYATMSQMLYLVGVIGEALLLTAIYLDAAVLMADLALPRNC